MGRRPAALFSGSLPATVLAADGGAKPITAADLPLPFIGGRRPRSPSTECAHRWAGGPVQLPARHASSRTNACFRASRQKLGLGRRPKRPGNAQSLWPRNISRARRPAVSRGELRCGRRPANVIDLWASLPPRAQTGRTEIKAATAILGWTPPFPNLLPDEWITTPAAVLKPDGSTVRIPNRPVRWALRRNPHRPSAPKGHGCSRLGGGFARQVFRRSRPSPPLLDIVIRGINHA